MKGLFFFRRRYVSVEHMHIKRPDEKRVYRANQRSVHAAQDKTSDEMWQISEADDTLSDASEGVICSRLERLFMLLEIYGKPYFHVTAQLYTIYVD